MASSLPRTVPLCNQDAQLPVAPPLCSCRPSAASNSSGSQRGRRFCSARPDTGATLERLEKLTGKTIAQQLEEAHGEVPADDDFSISLVSRSEAKVSNKPRISQQRNIRRQEYLNKVSQRDDSRTFAIIGLFVLVPPLIILGAATAAGYVQLLP